MSNNDEITDLIQDHDKILAKINNLIECLGLAIDFRDMEIGDLKISLQKLSEENLMQTELLQAFQDDDAEQKDKIQQLEQGTKKLRSKRDEFKQDAKMHRDENSVLKVLLQQYIESLQSVVLSLECIMPQEESGEISIPEESTKVVATGAFICCCTEDLAQRHERYFKRLTRDLPVIDFADRIIRVLSNSERPPIPQVDVVIILYIGLSHPDGNALRNTIRTMNPQPQIIAGNYLSEIIQNIQNWIAKRDLVQISS